MAINASSEGQLPWVSIQPAGTALLKGVQVGSQAGGQFASQLQANRVLKAHIQEAQARQQLEKRAMETDEARQNLAITLASRRFVAQRDFQTELNQRLSKAEAEAAAHGGDLDEDTASKIASLTFLKHGAAMMEGGGGGSYGSILGGMLGTSQRAATAEMTAEHRRGLLEAREKELNLSRDRLDEMSKQRDLDRQQKQSLQTQKDAVDRELETMKEQGRKDRSLLSAQTAISRASQIPDHMRRDAYKAEIQQLLNTFPSETEFNKGLHGIMDKYKVKPEPSANPVEVVPSAPAIPKASDRVKVRAPNGRIGTIPRGQLEQAMKEGFTEVQ